VSESKTTDGTPTMLIVLAICFVGVFFVGLYIGSTGVAAGSAGVVIATAAARSKLKKMNDEADRLLNSSALIIGRSRSDEDDLESKSRTEGESDVKSSRESLDTGDSAWERTRIFPDS
tara:strand:- start:4631 stop:4984 length:354 start_codon:yes stop_codon:yes gene_type:complete